MPKRTRSARDDDEVAPTPSGSGGRRGSGDEGKKRASNGGLRFKGTSSTKSAAKRARSSTVLPVLSLEGSLSEEILLRVLSFLSAHDLVTVARVSSAWHRLSYDPQLWRDLYLRTYASISTRRQAAMGGYVARTRPWRDLYKISTNWRSGSARTSTLGKGIRQAVLAEAPPEVALRPAVEASTPNTSATTDDEVSDTLLQFHHHFFFTASRTPSSSVLDPPSVTVHQTLPSGESAVMGSFSSSSLRDFFADRPDFRPSLGVTEMRLDEATPSPSSSSALLLAVFYSTGQFSLFRITLPSSSSSSPFFAHEVFSHLSLGAGPTSPFSQRPSAPYDSIRHARLHSPLLVTCSESLTVRFWRVSEGANGDVEVEEADTPLRTSERGWKPVVLSLAKVEAEEGLGKGAKGGKRWKGKSRLEDEGEQETRFRATLAYTAPVFPSSWTVGLQEFCVTLPSSSSSSKAPLHRPPRLSISARHAIALPLDTPSPPTPRRTSPFSHRAHLFTTLRNPVTSIEHSHPFVVASRRDNQLDVYEVVSSPPSAPPPSSSSTPSRFRLSPHAPRTPSPPQLKLEHRRTLFGHTARVAGVALFNASGAAPGVGTPGSVRCVSAGDDGAVKVWELTPSRASFSGDGNSMARKRRRAEETVVDVEAPSPAAAKDDDGETVWQRMKRRRLAGMHGNEVAPAPERDGAPAVGERPERIKQVLVGEDKIVLVGAGGGGGGEESVRVLRFD
ncbi:hypothetical protein JCM6882_007882 [Rhodosporidiobolus microsporus]